MNYYNRKNDVPAFPTKHSRDPGMGLRDYFAARAMAAMVGNPVVIHGVQLSTSNPFLSRAIAAEAYKFADAMLLARKDATKDPG